MCSLWFPPDTLVRLWVSRKLLAGRQLPRQLAATSDGDKKLIRFVKAGVRSGCSIWGAAFSCKFSYKRALLSFGCAAGKFSHKRALLRCPHRLAQSLPPRVCQGLDLGHFHCRLRRLAQSLPQQLFVSNVGKQRIVFQGN